MSGPQIIFIVLTLVLLGLGAGIWFWYRRKNKALGPRPKVAELRAFPGVEPKYVEFEGEKIHYIQTGRGQDIVLLHGIGASMFIWRFIFKALGEHYRVTAVDIPGFGRSGKNARGDYGLDAQRERLNQFLDFLKIRQAYLVGSSMGGAIALWMAQGDPQRFPKVAALAPATNPEIIPQQLTSMMARVPFAHKVVNRKLMKLILTWVVAKIDLITDEAVDAYIEPYQTDGVAAQTFLAAMKLLGDRRMPNCFKDLRSEVLLIQGQQDRLVTLKSVERLAKIIPSNKFVVTKTAGHHIMEDEPEWTTSEILNFFR